jgi:sortase A
MNRTKHHAPFLVWLMASCFTIGLWQVWEGSWMYAKAGLAQLLLQRAWTRSLEGEAAPKPWPWADTWPIARLQMPRLSVDLIVLAGAYGRTLAFGPGHVESSALPGQAGTMMLVGHRDTHFQFLKELHMDDRLEIMGRDGTIRRYRITEQRVMDSRRNSIPARNDREEVILVTCFPFDAITAGGPLGYVVRAEAVYQAERS